MKPSFKKQTLFLSLCASALISSPSFASGNGDSYSGPTLAPQVVNTTIDKPVTGKQLAKVMSSCFLPEFGSHQKGLISELFKNMTHSPLYQTRYPEEIESLFMESKPSGETQPLHIGIYQTGFTDRHERFEFTVRLKPEGALVVEYQRNQFGKKNELLISDFPIFKAKAKLIDSHDSISGEYLGQDYQFENLQVIYDLAKDPSVAARNVTDGRNAETQLDAPVADFYTCVSKGIVSLP